MKRTHFGLRSARRRCAIVSVWTIIMLFVLIMLIGFAIDAGYRFFIGQQLQNAADSAALAAAAKVRFNQTAAVNEAVAIAGQNPLGHGTVSLVAAEDIRTGHYDRLANSFATGAPFDAVEVTARRENGYSGARGPLPLFFMPIFGSNYATAYVRRKAIAMSGGTFTAGLVVLAPTQSGALASNGNITFNINGGGIQVNSSSATAVDINGNSAHVNASMLRINGGYTAHAGVLPNPTYTNTTPVPDPLGAVPAPVKGTNLGAIDVNNSSGTITVNPGYYGGGIRKRGNGSIVFNPGVYLVGPGTSPTLNLQLTGNGTITANGVMFYMTQGPSGGNFATVQSLTGSRLTMSPPTSGTYKGIMIFLDRTAPSTWTMAFGGGGSNFKFSGTIYLPSGAIDMQGGPDLGTPSQVIVNTIHLGGNPTININYDGRNPVTINNVFLVE